MFGQKTFKGGFFFPSFSGEPRPVITALFPKSNHSLPPILHSEIKQMIKRIELLPKLKEVKGIIINGVDCEPLGLPFEALLNERPNLLSEIKTILDLVYENTPIFYARTNERVPTSPRNDNTIILAKKYPQHHPVILANSVLGKKYFSLDQIKRDGILILDRWQVLRTAESCFGVFPNKETVLALSGPGIKEPQGWRVPIGTPVSVLLNNRVKAGDWLFIRNSLLNACPVDPEKDLIDEDTHSIIAIEKTLHRDFLGFLWPGRRRISFTKTFLSSWLPFKKAELNAQKHGEERNCVACNYCDDICPVGILPEQIYKRIAHGYEIEAKGLRPERCIECGLCTFACPSKIDLMKEVIKAKT